MAIQKTEKIWHNGKLIPWDNAQLHVMSHVVNYGSSVFEGVRCYQLPQGPAIFRANEPAGLHSGAGANHDFRSVLSRTNLCRNTARAVAGDFRLRTIRIDQVRLHIRFRIGKQPFHAVGADSAMAIAQPAAECAKVAGSVCTFHHQKIVAASRRLRERDSRALLSIILRGSHSCSVIPSVVTLANAVDSCNLRENTFCC